MTGITDLELTKEGEEEVIKVARANVGDGKSIDPRKVTQVFISPRIRAQRTCELLLGEAIVDRATYTTSNALAEWNHGGYEGKTVEEIRASPGKKNWSIWKNGCDDEGGE